MENTGLKIELAKLKDQTWQVARESLDQGEPRIYRTLTEYAERLSRLITRFSESGTPESAQVTPIRGDSSMIPIFARYKENRYEAQLDVARIDQGRGKCVQLEGQWRTASGSANHITNTSVNGWRNFWRYTRNDGSIAPIEKLKK